MHDDHDFVARLLGVTRCALALGELGLARQLAEGVEPTVPLYALLLASAGAQLAEAQGESARGRTVRTCGEGWRGFGAGLGRPTH